MKNIHCCQLLNACEQLRTYLYVFLQGSLLKYYYSLQLDHSPPLPPSARWEDHIAGSYNLSAATGQQLLEDNHGDFRGGQLQLYSDQKVAVPKPGTNLTTSQLHQSRHGTHHEYPPHLNNETPTSLDHSVGTLFADILYVYMSGELTHKLLLECMQLGSLL